MNKALQAKHVPEAQILEMMRATAKHSTLSGWDIADALGLPWKVVNAKLAAMARRGVVDGCSCGCSGGWHLAYTTGS